MFLIPLSVSILFKNIWFTYYPIYFFPLPTIRLSARLVNTRHSCMTGDTQGRSKQHVTRGTQEGHAGSLTPVAVTVCQKHSIAPPLCCGFQTPENGAADKRPPVPKAAPTPRATTNKNDSSANAASKNAGRCARLPTLHILSHCQPLTCCPMVYSAHQIHRKAAPLCKPHRLYCG